MSEQAEESYNLENISLSKFQIEEMAKSTIEFGRKYFSIPENLKRYEEWKASKNE